MKKINKYKPSAVAEQKGILQDPFIFRNFYFSIFTLTFNLFLFSNSFSFIYNIYHILTLICAIIE